MESGRRSVDNSTRVSTPSGQRHTASRSSVREQDSMTDLTSTTGSQPSTVRAKSPRAKSPTAVPTRTKTASPAGGRTKTSSSKTYKAKTKPRGSSELTLDSENTSVPLYHARRTRSPAYSDASPASVVDSSPRTPTQHSVLPSVIFDDKDRPATVEILDPISRESSVNPNYGSPMPPPPHPHHRRRHQQSYSSYMSPATSGAQGHDVRTLFRPLENVLNQYNIVIDTNGSLAVATGYRSVARRLLDRLENVFARNISSEHCKCLMCFDQPIPEDSPGVNWGEILELVSGRCELPSWPPYNDPVAPGLGISELGEPCQQIDVDVPDQYRAHYEKQAKKTKSSVQSWLTDQQDNSPEDADDETLSFIMLTRLDQPQRPLYYALLWGLDKLPNPRTQKPEAGTPPYLAKAGLALQRLYRLGKEPRDQLTVMYLIRNPDMHNILATLAAVTKHEWEILVSGRFDGFLWSGAEDLIPGQIPATDGPQRFASPSPGQAFQTFSPGPQSRPGSVRPGSVRPGSVRPGAGGPAPVQIDEETEVAVLAEIEREIYLGMEAMEDAFEHLHNQAEQVRRRLRERAAALSMVAQQRRGSGMDDIEVRMNTPAGFREQDDSLDDLRSEIGPDDSASNVSHNRRRKAHRARERRTPAPVEEESEGESTLADRIRRRF
ncbi:hypothetical protein N0V86_004619 [Didymella sp. IMI 355093]|nr:hypothetical protein N0V86_004619 [Didymella sp. IMI 355093]